jgi:hypothetical protein
MRYLLVTHIPFARQGTSAVMDRLWAEDLRGLAVSIGPVTIAAPLFAKVEDIQGWGPATDSLSKADGFEFLGLPIHGGRTDLTFARRVRAILRPAVIDNDLIHSSNFFPPYTPLWFGHDLAINVYVSGMFQLKARILFVLDKSSRCGNSLVTAPALLSGRYQRDESVSYATDRVAHC